MVISIEFFLGGMGLNMIVLMGFLWILNFLRLKMFNHRTGDHLEMVL